MKPKGWSCKFVCMYNCPSVGHWQWVQCLYDNCRGVGSLGGVHSVCVNSIVKFLAYKYAIDSSPYMHDLIL